MYPNLKISIFLFFVCFVAGLEGQGIGGRCRYDSNCFVEHSYCEHHMSCQCKENFTPTPDFRSCIATVGAVCETQYDCSSLDHSTCSENACACDRNHVPDSVGSTCLPVVAHLNEECVQDNQCQERLGEFSYCTFKACQCMPHYHFNGSRCIFSKRLEETCNNNGDCFLGEEFKHVIECRQGKCSCVPNFYNDNGHCYSGGGKLSTENTFIPVTIICFVVNTFIFYLR